MVIAYLTRMVLTVTFKITVYVFVNF